MIWALTSIRAAELTNLSIAERQRVEIIKVLLAGARILILDEPTAVLTDEEAARLLTTVRALAAGGAAVVLVTHKLGEVTAFTDRVTVMRNGRAVALARFPRHERRRAHPLGGRHRGRFAAPRLDRRRAIRGSR